MTSEYEAFLAHYGTKGQKWGQRRYQNEDGTYTEEGKLRYRKNGFGKPESDTWKSDEAKYLTDDELRRRNMRLQAESQYRQSLENRHHISKEVKLAAKAIFIGTAIKVASAAVATLYKDKLDIGKEFTKSFMANHRATKDRRAAWESAKKAAKAFKAAKAAKG